MTSKNDNSPVTRYDLNKYQSIIVKTQQLQQAFLKLKFPLLILDLEFFNRSHNSKQLDNRCCDLANGQSYVYLLQSAIYLNLQNLITSKPSKMIKSLELHRRWDEPNYSFSKKYQTLINHFVDTLLKHEIKTIVVAGASNDFQIINTWLQSRTKQLKAKDLTLEFWDVYPTLEKTMSFSNSTAGGEIFWEPQKLKKGFSGDNTISLPSLKKFFSYMTSEFPNFAYNDEADIYQLSCQILEFFCRTKLTKNQYQTGIETMKIAKQHCFNDVYKLITLLQYWGRLIFSTDEFKFSNE